jgi:hypothetical protein
MLLRLLEEYYSRIPVILSMIEIGMRQLKVGIGQLKIESCQLLNGIL